MGATRQLLRAYRVACHYSDTEAETEASLQITSSRVFNQILLFVLKEVNVAVLHNEGLSFTNCAAMPLSHAEHNPASCKHDSCVRPAGRQNLSAYAWP